MHPSMSQPLLRFLQINESFRNENGRVFITRVEMHRKDQCRESRNLQLSRLIGCSVFHFSHLNLGCLQLVVCVCRQCSFRDLIYEKFNFIVRYHIFDCSFSFPFFSFSLERWSIYFTVRLLRRSFVLPKLMFSFIFASFSNSQKHESGTIAGRTQESCVGCRNDSTGPLKLSWQGSRCFQN